jgi:hypothetical protein
MLAFVWGQDAEDDGQVVMLRFTVGTLDRLCESIFNSAWLARLASTSLPCVMDSRMSSVVGSSDDTKSNNCAQESRVSLAL